MTGIALIQRAQPAPVSMRNEHLSSPPPADTRAAIIVVTGVDGNLYIRAGRSEEGTKESLSRSNAIIRFDRSGVMNYIRCVFSVLFFFFYYSIHLENFKKREKKIDCVFFSRSFRERNLEALGRFLLFLLSFHDLYRYLVIDQKNISTNRNNLLPSSFVR